ncbi:hypothetical protein Ddye_014775 [Dipteronia dyeriana]|uniref:RNase H type-1 domain-containing protein n=1 Tax=Dipteronia dyeriana TaxID=168575 RepID=A0AAD9U499_9ROSI|nr:hypothetical protein Ddye_014775 [Dipteronia dyeriana]
MNCVSTVSYSFAITGNMCGYVKPSIGLRQGDPLSPYLFLMCAEGLSSIIISGIIDSDLSGFQCKRHGPNISHLFFANDSLLLSKANDRECYIIRNLLVMYAAASDQIINYDKSAMCFSKSVNWNEGDRLARLISVRHVRCHERYLGLPSFNCKNKRQLSDEIKDRVWAKIKGWKGKCLSIGSKEMLLKAIIQAIPTYIMGLFRLPKNLIHDLHGMCNRFWWGSSEERSKLHWNAWRNMCVSKEEGGLGFRDLEIFNRALLAKQCWRIIRKPDSLMTNSGGWNIDLLQDTFIADDIDQIFSIPPSNPSAWGYLLWHFEKSVEYSVRSGYQGDRDMTMVDSPEFFYPRCRQSPEFVLHALWGCRGLRQVNRDTATDYKNQKIGFGIIIRDSHGLVKVTAVKSVTSMLTLLSGEAMAVKHGILLALDSELVSIQIETDSLQLVTILSLGKALSSDVGSIISEI